MIKPVVVPLMFLALTAVTGAQESNSAHEDTHEWRNPERIADIQDDSERVRAFSVLIGQSLYDQMLEADGASGADEVPPIDSVNIIDITETLTPEEVRQLERDAEENDDQIARLQSYLSLQPHVVAELEDENAYPADVVALQLSEGGVLDVFIIPSWLND